MEKISKHLKYKESRKKRNQKKRKIIKNIILYSNHHFCEYFDDRDGKYEHICHYRTGCRVYIAQKKLKNINKRRFERKNRKIKNIIKNTLKISLDMINIIIKYKMFESIIK